MSTRFFLLAGMLCALSNCSGRKEAVQELFNGKDLSGWDTYLGPGYDTVHNRLDTTDVPGLNHDTKGVFTVVHVDGQPAIRISGAHNGGISTLKEFSNYHLTFEFKWGTAKWNDRRDKKRDSGLLYHAVGEHGADYGFWMRSQEFQIQEGDCGDYWGVAGGVMDIPAAGSEIEKYVYDPQAPLLDFSGTSTHGRRCIKNPDGEKPTGEWNVIDLYVLGDTAVHQINGTTVMVLYHSRQADDGKETPLTKGKIQLQSEGAEIFYRNFRVQPITALPIF